MSIGKKLFFVGYLAKIIAILAVRVFAGFVSGFYLGVLAAFFSGLVCYGFCLLTSLDRFVIYVVPFCGLVWGICVLGGIVLPIVTYDYKFAYADFMESLAKKD